MADISCSSGGIGYIVSQALSKKKPVVILIVKDNKTDPSVIMQGIKSRYAWAVGEMGINPAYPVLKYTVYQARFDPASKKVY